MASYHRIVIEQGSKKAFASALDWPGWSRSGKSEEDALSVFASYADRYKKGAMRAGVRGVVATASHPEVVDTLKGSGATDFGVPDKISALEYEFLTEAECERQISLLAASWDEFDDIASRVSENLRKGPRGGGRDREEIIAHTIEADRGYARRIGVKTPSGILESSDAMHTHREAVYAAIRAVNQEQSDTRWPIRYFIRRAAWHILDHAWEMEDKDLTGVSEEEIT